MKKLQLPEQPDECPQEIAQKNVSRLTMREQGIMAENSETLSAVNSVDDVMQANVVHNCANKSPVDVSKDPLFDGMEFPATSSDGHRSTFSLQVIPQSQGATAPRIDAITHIKEEMKKSTESIDKDETHSYRLDGSPFFAGHRHDNSTSYTLQCINRAFKIASAAVLISWVVLVIAVYWLMPAQYFRSATYMEKHSALLAAGLLLFSLLTKCIPLFLRGWKHALSGAIIGVLTVQVVAILTNFLMAFYPIPIRIDPVTNLEVYFPRWCEFTALSFMMCFLTEGVGINDITPNSPIWPNFKVAVWVSMSQTISCFHGLIFPLCSGKINWAVTMVSALCLYLIMFPRLFAKRSHFLSCSANRGATNEDVYHRARTSYRLMALCTCVWTTLVAFYFVAMFSKFRAPKESIWASPTSLFYLDTFFEAVSKVLYLNVIIDIHNLVFDEGKKALRKLEELRKMMSVVWECSSDLVAISVKGWNGTVTTMLNPALLKIDGWHGSQIRAIVFEQREEEFTKYMVNEAQLPENIDNTDTKGVPQGSSEGCTRSSKKSKSVCKQTEHCEPRLYWLETEDGNKVFVRKPNSNSSMTHLLNSVAEIILKSWTGHNDQLITHNLAFRGDMVVQCEGKVTKLGSNALVVVVQDISERSKLFEAEKKARIEVTARSKDAEANRFTRHEIKNGLLAAMSLCDALKLGIENNPQADAAASGADGITKHENHQDIEILHNTTRTIEELDCTLRDVLDTVLSEAMALDMIHEVYAAKMERVDVCALLHAPRLLNAESLYPIVTKPRSFPNLKIDPQLLKYIHRNALSNAVKYGKKGGQVVTELEYDKYKLRLQMKITNLPGENYDEILALGNKAREEVFSPGKRLHGVFGINQFAPQSSGDGAWISQKCAKSLGGHCDIFFEKNRTLFTFECPVTAFELKVHWFQHTAKNNTNEAPFELPTDTFGIAIDDSTIQRKLLGRAFTLLGIPANKQVLKGANYEEIVNFSDVVEKLMQSNPTAYFLLIVDENLELTENSSGRQTVSGSDLVQKLRNDLGPKLEKRMLALVRSANDSAIDIAAYVSKSHGFFPKAPISRQKVYDILTPLWLKRFPECAVATSPIANFSATKDESDMLDSSTAELMQTLEIIQALCKRDESELHKIWPIIWDKLHTLKGDLLCLRQSHLISHATASIELLRPPTIPNAFTSKWHAIKSLIEAELNGV